MYKKSGHAEIDMGLDFGYGFVAFFNGKQMITDKSDIWWGRNWNHGDVRVMEVEYKAGINKIEIWGQEWCCDGDHNVRIRKVRKVDYGQLDNNDLIINAETKYYGMGRYWSWDDNRFATEMKNRFNRAGRRAGYCAKKDVHNWFPFTGRGFCLKRH